MSSDTTSDTQGLPEKILARNEHFRKNLRVAWSKPHYPQTFDIIIQKPDGSYSAILICSDPDRRDMSATGGWTHGPSSALESLLDSMSKAVARKIDLLGRGEKDMRVTGNGIVNEAMRL
ncbi:hypothetical protein AC579_1839 [Pseudocercospora musae]|uniref:Uncharacterized protein n=1 Tax=Pseudocercospora musae TaxID=113226 RepID=A0A139I7J3_9PEZI|nr:hypothetical protein AC579_1839 [Pseudocercospora musae]